MKSEVKVSDAYYITGVGNVLLVDVVSGTIYPGMKCSIEDMSIEIKAINISKKTVGSAPQGSRVGIQVKVNGNDDLTVKVMGSKYHDRLKALRGKTLVFEGDAVIAEPQADGKKKKKRRSLFGVKRV